MDPILVVAPEFDSLVLPVPRQVEPVIPLPPESLVTLGEDAEYVGVNLYETAIRLNVLLSDSHGLIIP